MKFCLSGSFIPLDQLAPLAQAAEQSGWSMLSLADHVVYQKTIKTPYANTKSGARPWSVENDWPDVWVMIGALAASTKSINFVTSIFILPMRDPVMVAKQVSTAAVLSGNRVVMGVGAGWSKDEFELFGQNFGNRGKRSEEMVDILRKLWTGGYVEHRGRFYSFDALAMRPAPTSKVPVWIGGTSAAALKRAARLGDGWIGPNQGTVQILDCLKQLEGFRRECGRQDAAFDISVGPTDIDIANVDAYRRLRDAGVTYVKVRPWLSSSELQDRAAQNLAQSLDTKLAAIRRFGEQVISKV